MRASITAPLPPHLLNESFNLDAMPEAPLPPGWEARLSRSKGKVYYCHPALKLTQWERPTVESLKARKLAKAQQQQQQHHDGQ